MYQRCLDWVCGILGREFDLRPSVASLSNFDRQVKLFEILINYPLAHWLSFYTF